jgi:Tricorn protease C1 domain
MTTATRRRASTMQGNQRFHIAYPAPIAIPSARSRPVLARLVMPLLMAFSLALAGCAGGATPTPTRVPKPTVVIETRLTAAERAAIFDTAWQTVNDEYFDPTFGGKDWQAIGDEYRQKLATVQDDGTFWFRVLNPMLFELGVSHLAALPPELANQLEKMTFATGSLGMDVRLLSGRRGRTASRFGDYRGGRLDPGRPCCPIATDPP